MGCHFLWSSLSSWNQFSVDQNLWIHSVKVFITYESHSQDVYNIKRHSHWYIPIGTLQRWGLVALHGSPGPPSLTALTLNSYSLPSLQGTVHFVVGITPLTGCHSLPFSLFSTCKQDRTSSGGKLMIRELTSFQTQSLNCLLVNYLGQVC